MQSRDPSIKSCKFYDPWGSPEGSTAGQKWAHCVNVCNIFSFVDTKTKNPDCIIRKSSVNFVNAMAPGAGFQPPGWGQRGSALRAGSKGFSLQGRVKIFI